MASIEEQVVLEIKGRIATIRLNNPKKLNACTSQHWRRIAALLREIETMEDITTTVLMGTGRFFSAGADVKSTGSSIGLVSDDPENLKYLKSFGASNLELTRALYHHPKILVAALNGPAVGLAAAIAGHADFIFATPSVYLLVPFSSLGLVAEGGCSYMFAKRMGLGLANECLIGSKKISCDRLVASGFINKVFDTTDDVAFNKTVVDYMNEEYGDHLIAGSKMAIKKLIKDSFLPGLEAANLAEVIGGVEQFKQGVPQREFAAMAAGTKKHKL